MKNQPHSQNIAIFASGSGTNAENIINYYQHHDYSGNVALIVCNNPAAGVIQRAEKLGVPVVVLSKKEINDPEVMMPLLHRYNIMYIVLAGFLLLVPEFLVNEFDHRMVNIHPALLPKFGGKGMYGHHVHQAVKDAGETETGITVHYVNKFHDEGDIIFQARCPLSSSDSPDDIAAKIHFLEQSFFPSVIQATFFIGDCI